jgi:large subunit ribosomal protein L22
MIVKAINKYIRVSPYKLRPIIDVIRGSSVKKALFWLKVNQGRRSIPVLKTILSAYANAKNLHKSDVASDNFIIKEIRVDQGPSVVYFKPGAMGRASVQNKRTCHLMVILEKKLI